jgi:excisionase family DNA binding protein
MSIHSCGAGKDALKPLTVTVNTTRQLTGLGHSTVWQLIKDGRLKTIKVGKRRLVIYRSLELLLTPREV